MEDHQVNPKMLKIMVAGALAALAMDYFINPSIKKTVGLR